MVKGLALVPFLPLLEDRLKLPLRSNSYNKSYKTVGLENIFSPQHNFFSKTETGQSFNPMLSDLAVVLRSQIKPL